MTLVKYLISIFLVMLLFAQDIGKGPAFIVKISEEAAKEIESENGVLEDAVLLNQLQPIVRDIMKASDIRQIFPCRILKSDVFNAFALPAGPIYVTMGMLGALDSLKTEESKSMLAGVIGHEIAHVYLRHSVAWSRLDKFIKDQPSIVPSDIAELLERGYVREQEFEADEYGVIYAMRAGYDFEAIIKFYKKAREVYGETPPGDEIYNDHPRITERIARLYEVRGQLERDFDQFNFGVEALKEGKHNEAVSYFRAFTTTFTNSANGWTNLGTAYLFEAMAKMEGPPILYMVTYYTEPKERLRGKPDELTFAEEAFKRAAEVDTSYNIVYYGNMGIIAALNGEYDKAIEYSEKALKGGEAEHFFYNNLGNALYLKQKYEDAEDNYKKAIELAENWPLPVYNLALLYEAAGQKELAIEQWKLLLDASGFNQEAVKHLAQLDKKFKPETTEVEPEGGLGDIRISMSEDSVLKLLGEPDNRMAIENLIALEYDAHKVVIFSRDKKISGILAQPGFTGATSKGIKIGSSTSEVRTAYGLPDDIVQQKDEEQWIYGKIGILISIYESSVSSFQIVQATH